MSLVELCALNMTKTVSMDAETAKKAKEIMSKLAKRDREKWTFSRFVRWLIRESQERKV